MLILPAIDLYEKKAVRLHKGDYAQMTVYNDHPLAVAEDFAAAGAQWIHIVDLEGARDLLFLRFQFPAAHPAFPAPAGQWPGFYWPCP